MCISTLPHASVKAAHCMVATGHPLACEAALQVLSEAGSAVDAAIAADAVLGVVEPMATGIGGDLMAMIVAPDGPAQAYNGSGRAPMALSTAILNALPGGRIGERHPLSVTTPGAVRGWADLHARHGRLPWARLLKPAIACAHDGFPVAPIAAREWHLFAPVLHADPQANALFRGDAPPKPGERFANPELAATLQAIADGGPDAFYRGQPAVAASAAVQARGGVLQASDFALHAGEFVEPLAGTFRGWTVLECPPNTHGVSVLLALAELDALELDFADPLATVRVVQAMERAMAEAKRTVEDPSGNTVCTVVVDREGLAVTLMSSVFKRFGSGIAVPGAGCVLQNRGFGFAAPGGRNGARAGRRPFHTVVPAAALVNGRFHAALGVVGGAMQPQGQLQLLLRLAAQRQGLQAAIGAPRWRLEAEHALAIENGVAAAVQDALRAAGFRDPRGLGELGGRSDFGGAQCVMRAEDGQLLGGSDHRKDGVARGL